MYFYVNDVNRIEIDHEWKLWERTENTDNVVLIANERTAARKDFKLPWMKGLKKKHERAQL